MKVWREFGSSHSGNVTVVGQFDSDEKAKAAFPVIEDFVKGAWEGRYENVQGFISAWKARDPNMSYHGLTEDDFQIGVDDAPDVDQAGSKVVVANLRSENVSGIVKLLFGHGMKEIQITGHGA